MKAVRSNWRTAAISGAICLVLIVAIAVLSARPSSDAFLKRPSTFFTDSSGSRAIYLVLQRVLPSVEQWRYPLTSLTTPSKDGISTLIALGPDALGPSEAEAFEAWLAAGGQLIIATGKEWIIGNRSQEKPDDFLARHDIQAASKPDRGSSVDAAVTKTIGRGRIIYVPDSHAFSNEALRMTDNAAWLADRCLEWGGGAAFDEYHLGFMSRRTLSSLIAMFAVTPWGLACMQLALAGAIYLFGCKRRFGRPVEEPPAERTNPIEAVEAAGGLFEMSKARTLSVRTIHQYLNSYASTASGYRVDLLEASMRERLGRAADLTLADLDFYAGAVRAAESMRPIDDAEFVRFGKTAAAIARSFKHGVVRDKHSAAAG